MKQKEKRAFREWFLDGRTQRVVVIITFIAIPMLLLALFTYIPFLDMVRFSLYDRTYLDPGTFVGLNNYKEVFSRTEIFGSLIVSVYYMGGAVVQLALALFFASLKEKQEALSNRKNAPSDFYNGIYTRWANPVLTREMAPLHWRYDLNPETNPFFQERLGINAALNAGAIELDGKFYLVARMEGSDRKSFFAVAESESGVDGFRFWDYPVVLPDSCPEETNVYDMRLTKHEDGWIYGVFCSERHDPGSADLSAAVAAAGIARTRDLKAWERLPNLVTLRSPQQRNVCLLPSFISGKYAFYTRPMDDFIETGTGGGIGFGLCDDITHAVIDREIITSPRRYHTITESKNGAGAVPFKTEKGWIHIAHGVRNTAAGLRYVIYAFATDLHKPWKVIAEPGGFLIAPLGPERVGDVSNVVFTNGAIVRDNGEAYIYYASDDTRLHVATTTVERMVDYVFNTHADPLRSVDCVKQRCGLIDRNLEYLQTHAQPHTNPPSRPQAQ